VCRLQTLANDLRFLDINFKPLKPELNPSAQRCRDFLLGILIFKGLTARRLSKPFGVKG
jgi:hypothetical protein